MLLGNYNFFLKIGILGKRFFLPIKRKFVDRLIIFGLLLRGLFLQSIEHMLLHNEMKQIEKRGKEFFKFDYVKCQMVYSACIL